MKVIWKYHLSMKDVQTISLPANGQFVWHVFVTLNNG